MHKLYIQFTNGNEGYYRYEKEGFAYVGSIREGADFPSRTAAIAKARRMISAGYRIAYYEAVYSSGR